MKSAKQPMATEISGQNRPASAEDLPRGVDFSFVFDRQPRRSVMPAKFGLADGLRRSWDAPLRWRRV